MGVAVVVGAARRHVPKHCGGEAAAAVGVVGGSWAFSVERECAK